MTTSYTWIVSTRLHDSRKGERQHVARVAGMDAAAVEAGTAVSARSLDLGPVAPIVLVRMKVAAVVTTFLPARSIRQIMSTSANIQGYRTRSRRRAPRIASMSLVAMTPVGLDAGDLAGVLAPLVGVCHKHADKIKDGVAREMAHSRCVPTWPVIHWMTR